MLCFLPRLTSRYLLRFNQIRTMSTHYSAVIIGSGQGGGPLAQAFANAGHKTALIESAHVGGTCVNGMFTFLKRGLRRSDIRNEVQCLLLFILYASPLPEVGLRYGSATRFGSLTARVKLADTFQRVALRRKPWSLQLEWPI